MSNAALSAAQWVVGKALAPVADGLLEAWAGTRNLGLNIEALSTELLLVKAMLEQAALKELGGPAMEILLLKLRDSAHNAEDLLDELDYFRIHDELHGTYNAADQHGKSGIHNLVVNAHHTAKAFGKQLASLSAYWFGANAGDHRQQDARQHVNYCASQHGKKRLRGDFSSAPNANQADEEVSRRMPKLGKFLHCSSSPHPHVHDDNCSNAQETPKLEFNRVDFSQRVKGIIEKLQLMRNEVSKILQCCGPRTVPNIALSRPITKGRIDEPKLYGRDWVMNSIIHDITKGQYCDKGLTVLPVVGPGGMGKTTLIQHIYRNQQMKNHFPVMIWICVSLNFSLDKVLEQIKTCTPAVENEKKGSTTEELIEQRLKSKRFLLVLDDIWQISNGDDWENLLSILNQSQEKGCTILVTTRFQAIAQKVKTGHSIQLNGLESEEFRKLFFAFVFGDEQCARDKHFLLETGDKIMQKLKGSPLAAKTVGRVLSKELSLHHWKRVLKSKEWETDKNGIMPALRLSYDFLPFHLQQCFSYSALFPEDYCVTSHQLIGLWTGLDILISGGQNQTLEDIGLRNLNELVIHGFFREEETYAGLRYVMHDLLHDLALKVASHDCLSLRLPNVESVEVQPSTHHLSISIEDLGEYDAVSGQKLKSGLKELKTRLEVEHLQSLMLFGKMDKSFAKVFGDFFGEANALRVLYLPSMMYPVECMLHNFSRLVHLRFLCLGTWDRQMHLPLNMSKLYHLRILDLESWYGSHDLPEDMRNLAKLCHFYTPIDCFKTGPLYSPIDEQCYDIYNVGKLIHLEELEVFQVNKRSEGFEPKQLETLTKLRELGMYNLHKIHTEEEAAQVKLIEKNYLRRLTLDWDSKRSNVDPCLEALVLERLQPHGDLQVLCIRGHGGPSCPTWLGDEFGIEALQSLYLSGVSWEVFPSLGKAWDLRELRLEHIGTPKEFIIEKSFCMLIKLELIGLESFEKWVCPAKQESALGTDLSPPHAHMFPLLQVLFIMNCPKFLWLPSSNHIVSPDWFPKLQEFVIVNCPQFLSVTPISWIERLHRFHLSDVKLLHLFKYSKSSDGVEVTINGEGDLHSLDQVLVLDKEAGFEKLTLGRCPPLELKHLLMLTSLKTLIVFSSDALVGPLGGQGDFGWQLPIENIRMNDLNGTSGKELIKLLPHLPRLSKLEIEYIENIVGVDLQQTTSAISFFRQLFPSSLQFLGLRSVEGMGTLESLSNLSSLTILELNYCGHDLKCQGLRSLLTSGGQLNKLKVFGSPSFFVGWDPNPRRALEDVEGEEQQTQLVSSTLRELCTDDAAGLLAVPICSFLSSSLSELGLRGNGSKEVERFSKEQEDALQLLPSLQKLEFWSFHNLQQLPARLHNLTSLEILSISDCPAISSLPSDDLPKSLQELNVRYCSEELKQQCRGLVGTIPRIIQH
ncbi:hypothetical protein ACQJBY_014384 [Aegilops geniculata]